MALELKDCRWPWNSLYVKANGDVKPCCYAALPLGNAATEDSLAEIWTGPEMESLRAAISNNRLHSICAGASCAFVRSRLPTASELDGMAKYKRVPQGIVPERIEVFARLGRGDCLFQLAVNLLNAAHRHKAGSTPWHARGRSYANAMLWMHRAASNGSELADYHIASELFRGPLRRLGFLAAKLAHRYARRSAEAGYGAAYVLRGTMDFYGFGGGKPDYGKALEMFRKGAEAGDPMGYMLQGNILRMKAETQAEGDRLVALAIRRGVKAAAE